jgi:hypothetical protein
MMKAILGSALGGVVAGLVALVASAQGRAPEAAWSTQVQPNAPYAMTVANAAAPAAAAPVVQCEPHQEAVLQRSFVGGREVAQVTCVTRAIAPAPYAAPAAGYYVPAGYVPAAAPVAAPVSDIVERPAVRRVSQTRRVVPAREVEPKRSWKKSALVIGGAAGAGAGVGALAGGKKGALIGAAIGGGSGAIYEAIKRK